MRSTIKFLSDSDFESFLGVIRCSYSFNSIKKGHDSQVLVRLPIHEDHFLVSSFSEGMITIQYDKAGKKHTPYDRIALTLKEGEMVAVYNCDKSSFVPEEIKEELEELISFILDDKKTLKAIRATRKAYLRFQLIKEEEIRAKLLKTLSPILKGDITDNLIEACETTISQLGLPARVKKSRTINGDGVTLTERIVSSSDFSFTVKVGEQEALLCGVYGGDWVISKSLEKLNVDMRCIPTKSGYDLVIEIPYDYVDSFDCYMLNINDENVSQSITDCMIDINHSQEDIDSTLELINGIIEVFNKSE